MQQGRALFLHVSHVSRPFTSSKKWNNCVGRQLRSHLGIQHIVFKICLKKRSNTIFEIHHQCANYSSSRQESASHRHGRRCLTICHSSSDSSASSTDEGDAISSSPDKSTTRRQYDSNESASIGLSDGSLESSGPKFSRLPYSALSFIPVNDPAAALPPKTKIKLKQGFRRGRRAWKKISPAQAMTGAIVGAVWAVMALRGTSLAYEHLDSHPLARDLPMGLTKQVNQLLLTTVTGFGGFAVVMFGVSSLGLFLLTLKLLSAPKP